MRKESSAPFLKCLHPIRTYNKYTGEPITTNCGKCMACILHKAGTTSLRCQLESTQNQYCMFVTLTYDNEHIPLADSILYKDDYGNDKVILKNISERITNYSDVVLSDSNYSHKRFALLQQKCNINGFIPYLHYDDIQKFMKRFRKNLDTLYKSYYNGKVDYYFNLLEKKSICNSNIHRDNLINNIIDYGKRTPEKIRYFVCGELGPVHFRPHWHLLLWFKEQETLSFFAEALHKSWTFGRIDFSLSQGKASSYCASYVNSSVCLPEIFKSREIRPKSYHSLGLGEGVYKGTLEKIRETSFKDIDNVCIPLDGKSTMLTMWRTLAFKFFPLCKGFAQKSTTERHYAYMLYAKVRKWTQEVSPFKQAKIIADLISKHGFDYEYFHSFLPYDIMDIFEYFRISNNYEPCKISFDYEQLFSSIYNELRISYKFISLLYNVTSDEYLSIIEDWYSYKDYQNLKMQYEQQTEYLDNELLSPNEVYFMYNNSPHWFVCDSGKYTIKDKFLHSPLMMQYNHHIKDRYEKSIKHKELNDRNNIFIN